MSEKIGNVKLNYDFYSGVDTYSDGDIEDRLLEIVQSGADLDEVLTGSTEWAILYHLSPIRHNLLSWYDFGKDKSLLEIGSGCGAVTGIFCEKCGKVTSVDLSKRRSTINAWRNKDYDNLEIMVGNFEDIKFSEKYDYVSLIGVLEYSVYYLKSETPFLDMLKKAKSLLKPGGKLIIAIENKYGIKYWAGATEDHTGVPFDGITGYVGVNRVETFSRNSLKKLILDSGFKKTEFYYPVPDYKMPLEIYSEDRLPGEDFMNGYTPAFDRDRYLFFDEGKAMNSLIKDGMFEDFANSFLVICS